jgi:hypothetical protein
VRADSALFAGQLFDRPLVLLRSPSDGARGRTASSDCQFSAASTFYGSQDTFPLVAALFRCPALGRALWNVRPMAGKQREGNSRCGRGDRQSRLGGRYSGRGSDYRPRFPVRDRAHHWCSRAKRRAIRRRQWPGTISSLRFDPVSLNTDADRSRLSIGAA